MRRIAVAIISFLTASGCGKTPSATVAPPSPGMAVVELSVIAEPHDGVKPRDPNDHSYVTAVMEPVDYASLPDIVLWLEPADSAAPAAPAVAIEADPSRAATNLTGVAGVGAKVSVKNKGTSPADFYSVTDGNEFDLGRLEPGAGGTFVIRSPGLIEILSDSSRDPVATIYAAPTSLVRSATAGQTLEFRDVKPGLYKAGTWHSRLPGREIQLNLPADQVTNAIVKVGVNGLKQVGN
jgi:hypothetical protein